MPGATVYHAIAIPAAGVFAAGGFVMPPAMGAVAMSARTVIVTVNARLYLHRHRPWQVLAASPGTLPSTGQLASQEG